MLAFFTEDENQTEKLREFSSPEGQDDMYAYCQRPRRTVAEVLFDFKSAKIKLDYILDLFPMMQPRSFSIASDPKVRISEPYGHKQAINANSNNSFHTIDSPWRDTFVHCHCKVQD